jgi:type IV secretory pathway ATPase VirB11/archaellum biosynthesis ATPase
MLKVENRSGSPVTISGKHVSPGRSILVEKLDESAEFLQRNGAISVLPVTSPPPVVKPVMPTPFKPAPVAIPKSKSVPGTFSDRKES